MESVKFVNDKKYKETFTITYGDCAENHVGMQKIGSVSSGGFTLHDLKNAKEWFEKEDKNIKIEIIHLNDKLYPSDDAEDAYILIARKGVDVILKNYKKSSDNDDKDKNNGIDKSGDNDDKDNNKNKNDDKIEDNRIYCANDFFKEQNDLEKDTKAKMYGRVVDKHARYNLCFGKESQKPDYENGKGTIVKFEDVPILNYIRLKFKEIIPNIEGMNDLVAEGNYYYDVSKCGIGFHGDAERRKVIGVRLGASIPLHYQWYKMNRTQGSRERLILNHGDIYIMSEKATGFDWKRKKVFTLRHAAGAQKFLMIDGKC